MKVGEGSSPLEGSGQGEDLVDLEDPEDNEPLVRGADGEYGMTRGKTTG